MGFLTSGGALPDWIHEVRESKLFGSGLELPHSQALHVWACVRYHGSHVHQIPGLGQSSQRQWCFFLVSVEFRFLHCGHRSMLDHLSQERAALTVCAAREQLQKSDFFLCRAVTPHSTETPREISLGLKFTNACCMCGPFSKLDNSHPHKLW